MDSTVDAMEAAYDALVDALAAAVQAAIADLGLDPSSHEDLQAAARRRGQEEKETEDEKGPFPTTPLAAVAAGEK